MIEVCLLRKMHLKTIENKGLKKEKKLPCQFCRKIK